MNSNLDSGLVFCSPQSHKSDPYLTASLLRKTCEHTPVNMLAQVPMVLP